LRPGNKGVARKKHRREKNSARRSCRASAEWGGPIGRPAGGRPYIGISQVLGEERLARPAQEMRCALWFLRVTPLLPGRARLEIQSPLRLVGEFECGQGFLRSCIPLFPLLFYLLKMEKKHPEIIFTPPRIFRCGKGFLLSLGFLFFFIFLSSPPGIARKKDGVYHPVTQGVTLYRISRAYKIPIAKLMEANKLSSPSAVKVGQKLFIPGAKAILPVEPYVPLSPSEKKKLEQSLDTGEQPLPPPPLTPEGSRERQESEKPPWWGKELDIMWPIQGKITSPFGPRGKRFHGGIDIRSPSYQEVKAAMDGEVILARNTQTGYGKVVFLRHDQGFTTIYGHLNVIMAKEGEAVRQGQSIGGVGSTGKSTGPHLHFELRHNSRPLNPLPLLPPTIEEFLEKATKK
jgi:murein DD-endopeptidase MepM/ murein hydrolase activator NlpD